MTGIELLRMYTETVPAISTDCKLPNVLGKECDDFVNCDDCHRFVCNAIADQIEREIDEAVADEVADTLNAYEMHTNARWYSAVEEGADSDCKAEYEMISRYWLPRPRFEDGEVVGVGDWFLDSKNRDCVVYCVSVTAEHDGTHSSTVYATMDSRVTVRSGERVKRPEPPDTWERVQDDVAKGNATFADILRRCNALAGVE